MQTIEVSFVNRRKEKITADAISFTEAPGWIVVKTAGAVAEMIPASTVKRLKFLPTVIAMEPAEPAPEENRVAEASSPLLRLPSRREIMDQRRHFSPLVSQRH